MEHLPVKGEAKIGITKEIKELKEISDHKNFPPFTNKIETIGFLRKKTFLVICDGKGNMNFERLGSDTEKLRENLNAISRLADLLQKNAITRAEFDDLKKNIMTKMKKDI